MLRVLAVCIAAFAFACGSAGASWNTASKIPLDKLSSTVTFHFDRCPDGGPEPACAVPPGAGTPTTVYIDLGDPTFLGRDASEMKIDVYYHEMGHVLDYTLLTDADRVALTAAMGLGDRAWRLPSNSPHEQFAEAFSLCARFGAKVSRKTLRAHVGGYAWTPTVERQRDVCRRITVLLRRLD